MSETELAKFYSRLNQLINSVRLTNTVVPTITMILLNTKVTRVQSSNSKINHKVARYKR